MKQNRLNRGWQAVFPDFRRVGVYADPEAEKFAANAGKWLADLVICSARMAQQLHLDLDENVQHRINTLIERWGGE